ncbi:winged helix-turn-helix domain-containing protein [Sneathiella sp. P13V-1]|uniref:winged helix-turn-helix domain-containing protein n=1 Tax=Sneathiella sp. P13V-1 TaxID=2697366 RepID=UPI00187B8B5F|nr:crosslink repair DNA glycosylase YcaQ family protein [Sneathiella sp. P13V-1]MBE7636975.1 winged helix-turn-helix domain-containing protein [Sneathiella sp. P13V-1]
MKPISISNKEARQLWLSSQGLGEAPTGPLDVLGIIKKLGFVQLDTIQVVSRAHHHILWSRNQNYREPMLDQLLGQDRSIFEHFTHDASVIPMDYLPMWQRQFRRKKEQMDRPGWFKNPPDKSIRNAVLERIRDEGPLSTHAFDTKVVGEKKMWSRPPHKLALDYMWYSGELATSHRVNFTKFYDLAERVFPEDLHRTQMSDEEQIDWLCRAALDRMGFGTAGDIQRYWDALSAKEVRDWIARSNATLQTVDIETAKKDRVVAFAPSDIEERLEGLKPATSRLRILNPFDPVIRDRDRLSRLFGFEYRVEMFVPADKRIWGYYVYPILEGHRFVGRIEVKADRKKSVLNVINFWPEKGCQWPTSRRQKLTSELDRMKKLVGVDDVVWAV